MRAAYRSFVNRLRDADRQAVISFNQVNGVPDRFSLPAPPSYRYVEVWQPNDRWTHLEGLMVRSADPESRNGIYALYPPVWDKDRSGAVATVVQSLAIATMLGGGALSLGDTKGALSHPYYPNFERLGDGEADTVLAWHRFALRCRDLFSSGADTSWVEIGDENGAVALQANGTEVRPEPQAGAVFARVVRHESTIAIGCLDLTSSESASWMRTSGFSSPRTVTVACSHPLPRTPALRPPSSVITATDSSPFPTSGSSTGRGPRSNSNSPSMPAGRSPGCTDRSGALHPGAPQSSGRDRRHGLRVEEVQA